MIEILTSLIRHETRSAFVVSSELAILSCAHVDLQTGKSDSSHFNARGGNHLPRARKKFRTPSSSDFSTLHKFTVTIKLNSQILEWLCSFLFSSECKLAPQEMLVFSSPHGTRVQRDLDLRSRICYATTSATVLQFWVTACWTISDKSLLAVSRRYSLQQQAATLKMSPRLAVL